jgi:hypothetical protein
MKKRIRQVRQFIEGHRDSSIALRVLGSLIEYARDSYVHGSLSPRYKSEHAQDGYVDNHFQGMGNGFYVEVGAHIGLTKSNTYFFHFARGWRGVCIEPNPQSLIGHLKDVFVFLML